MQEDKTAKKIGRIVKGSFWLYFGSALALFLGALTTVVLSRLLDKELWGIFASTIAVTSFFSAICDIGLGYTTTHKTSELNAKRKFKELKNVIGSILKYRLLIILSIAFLIFLSSDFLADFFHAPGSSIYFKISALYFFFFNLFGSFDGIIIGLTKFKESTSISFLQYTLRLIFSLIFVAFGFGVSGALGGYILSLVLSTFVQVYILRRIIAFWGDVNIVPLFKYGFFVGIANVGWAITLWTDSIMIGFFLGATLVGIYKIAFTVASAASSFLGNLNRVLFPIFTEEESKGRETVSDLNKVINYGSFFAIPAVFGIAILSEGIIRLFFSVQYIESALVLSVLSYFIFDSVIIGAIIAFLAARKETKIIGNAAALTAGSNVILNLIFIPILGIVGAAIASVITRIINFAFLLNHLIAKKISINLNYIIRPLVGSIFMAFVLVILIYPTVITPPFYLKEINPITISLSPPFLVNIFDLFKILILGVIGAFSYFLIEVLLGFDIIPFFRKLFSILNS